MRIWVSRAPPRWAAPTVFMVELDNAANPSMRQPYGRIPLGPPTLLVCTTRSTGNGIAGDVGGVAPVSWTVNCFRFTVVRSRPGWTMKSRITAMARSVASGSTPCPHPGNRSKRTRCAGRATAISI
jgi:hypothetical protein